MLFSWTYSTFKDLIEIRLFYCSLIYYADMICKDHPHSA